MNSADIMTMEQTLINYQKLMRRGFVRKNSMIGFINVSLFYMQQNATTFSRIILNMKIEFSNE